MATTTNGLTKDILKFWFELRVFAYRQNSSGIFDQRKGIYRPAAKVGLPDTIAILPHIGRYCGVEIKVGRDKLRPEQIGALRNIKLMGGVGIVVKDFPDFIKQVSPILEGLGIEMPSKYLQYV